MWFFILTLHFAELGGGGMMYVRVETTTERLCQSVHNIAVHQITTPNAVIGDCTKADPK
jgi:hypothetical protein